VPLSDDAVVREIREFIVGLVGIESMIVSDHILNLLEELTGKLPEGRTSLLAVLDRYLSLSERDRLIFRLGRRRGVLRTLDDLANKNTYQTLDAFADQFEGNEKGSLEKHLALLKDNYV
ncbi:MAG: radical SAM protein, partial [Syntrophales bacterium LBB04]|nr:radical SAM protein [Syntrophales bacterium LBB04]